VCGEVGAACADQAQIEMRVPGDVLPEFVEAAHFRPVQHVDDGKAHVKRPRLPGDGEDQGGQLRLAMVVCQPGTVLGGVGNGLCRGCSDVVTTLQRFTQRQMQVADLEQSAGQHNAMVSIAVKVKKHVSPGLKREAYTIPFCFAIIARIVRLA
jgi:hypothetical protein